MASGIGRWRTATLVLVTSLLLSWAFFAYMLVDAGVSLTYCRAQGEYLQHDVEFLVAAGVGRLSAQDFLAVRAKQEPELPIRLDEGSTLLLRSTTLRFGEDSRLAGIATP